MKRIVLAAGVLAIGFAALAQSAFEGVWKVKDTAGHPFEITLSSGGAAKATRGEGMTGIDNHREALPAFCKASGRGSTIQGSLALAGHR